MANKKNPNNIHNLKLNNTHLACRCQRCGLHPELIPAGHLIHVCDRQSRRQHLPLVRLVLDDETGLPTTKRIAGVESLHTYVFLKSTGTTSPGPLTSHCVTHPSS